MSVDPLVAKTMQPYIYGTVNPIRFSDPSGLESFADLTDPRHKNSLRTMIERPESIAPIKQYMQGHPSTTRVEEIGNLGGAQNIVVFVPGAGTTLQNFDETVYDRTLKMMNALIAAGGGSTAGVAWLGYDAPGNLGAVSGDAADGAHPVLGAYVSGLAEQYPDANLILVGHSYGAVVVGRSIGHGEVPDDAGITFVSMGSPGYVRRELKDSFMEWSGSTIRIRGDNDRFVGDSAWHGKSPAAIYETVPGGHNDYWTDDNLGTFGDLLLGQT